MALGAGSIAFTGFNADGNDNIAFVVLQGIAAGTVITFTDNEWTGAAFNAGESVFRWTAATDIAAGSIVTIDAINTAAPTSNRGTVVYLDATNPGLSNSNEILYAYTGSANAPVFLSAIANDGFANEGATLDGTGLVAGTDAIDLGLVDADADIGAYTGARTGAASFAAYRALVNDVANWTIQDASGDQSNDGVAPEVPFSQETFGPAMPQLQVVSFSPASLEVARAEGNAGTTEFTFTLVRSGGTTGAVTVTGQVFSTQADANDFGAALPLAFTGTIAAGQTSGTVTIAVRGDTVAETNERFFLSVQGVSNDAGVSVVNNTGTATGTILNDDNGRVLNRITVYDAAPSLAGSTVAPVATDDAVLVRLGSFAGGGSTAAGRAESVAFDAGSARIFVTNAAQGRVDVAQLAADSSTNAAGSIDLTGLPDYGGVNSVAVANGVVAVAYQNSVGDRPGTVALFDAPTGTLVRLVTVGVLPDEVTFTPDGTRLLVANEGEALSAATNPAGSISIIDLSNGAGAAVVANTIGFGALDGFEATLRARGLALFGGQSASADIEPEYITVSPDGTRAYVTLQEVNAVAVIDLTDPAATRPLAIQPLGGVDHALAGNAFDASDRDGDIKLVNANVVGLLQPDAIASWQVNGTTYFVTANEGDARVGGLVDEVRLSSGSYVLDPTAYPNAAAIKANDALGRLNVLTNVGDTDGDGDYDQIYTFGGRSISIFRQETDGSITKVRETGGEFEAIIARDYSALFNSDQALTGTADTRSDNKGPEPEGVTIGQVGDRTYAFVGLERVGGVMVYDVTDPANARFVSYRPETAADLGPEVLTFVAAGDNPTGAALLLSANEVSGETTLYRVVQQTAGDDLIEGAAGTDHFDGRAGNDRINGLAGNDRLLGGAGNDQLFGGEGSDLLDGGTGDDQLNGGLGGDVFLFRADEATGRDRIDDFGLDDVLVTTGKLFDSNGDGVVTFGRNRVLDFDAGGVLAINGVRALEYDGSYEQGGISYYVYSRVGSAAGVAEAAAGTLSG